MNLRISSLDPNAPRAGVDCRVCNRRRIKCDRSLPTCKKCGIRKLECSGYEQKLKWGQGIASRGKFTGLTVPISNVASRRPQKKASSIQVSQTLIPPKERLEVEDMIVGTEICRRNSPAPSRRIEDDEKTQIQLENYCGIDLSLSWTQLPGPFQNPYARRLIHHFDHHVAANLVWVDSTDNPWRNYILPLAMEAPSLLFAILALAGEHLCTQMQLNGQGSEQGSLISNRYRDKSLELLTQKLRTEVYHGGSNPAFPDLISAKSILATMLVLCNVEMVPSDSTVWNLHLQASRTMMRLWLLASSSMDLTDTTSEFLRSEFFVLDVMASTSSFDNNEEVLMLQPKEAEFSEYLHVVHDITIAERRQSANMDLGLPATSFDMADFHRRFEHARTRTRRFSRGLELRNERISRDFDRIVDIFHHAGLIYSYQALAEPELAAETIKDHFENLIEDLKLVPASGILAQDLAWPLFITGTACRGRQEEQQLVERLMVETMQSTGFSNSQQALQFLRMFWSVEDAEGGNWIRFARAKARGGYIFLAT